MLYGQAVCFGIWERKGPTRTVSTHTLFGVISVMVAYSVTSMYMTFFCDVKSGTVVTVPF
jgi:hypothetical protein